MYKYENLVFRKVERQDLKRLLLLKRETWPVTHTTAILNMEDQERWFESLDHDVHCPRNLVLIIERPAKTAEDTLYEAQIGVFKIFNINYVNCSANVAWDVFRSMRGQGLGKVLVRGGVRFCVEVLGLRRLDAEILVHNKVSEKCALAAGFVKEGVRRQAVFKSGGCVDSVIYGYLREEVPVPLGGSAEQVEAEQT